MTLASVHSRLVFESAPTFRNGEKDTVITFGVRTISAGQCLSSTSYGCKTHLLRKGVGVDSPDFWPLT